jgi:hypothetical protein
MRTVMLTIGVTAIAAAQAGAGEDLRLRVSPRVALAPATIVVQATVTPNDRNRWLAITAESDDFYRSSEVTLHGSDGPRTTQVMLPGLPSGDYEVTATIYGTGGRISDIRADLRVMSGSVE